LSSPAETQSSPSRDGLRIVVVGGGISGLTCAHAVLREARERGRDAAVSVLEADARLGGRLRTERHEGFLIDAGGDSFVVTKPHALALCRELGLEARLIETRPENRRVYIVRRGELHPLPPGLVFGVPTKFLPFLNSPLLSLGGKLRALAESGWRARAPSGEDVSLADFLERRFGAEMMDIILEPLLGGIYAGDARTLSLKSTFPQWFGLHERGVSVIRAIGRDRRWPGGFEHPGARHELTERSPFRSLVGGTGELMDALLRSVGQGTVRISTSVEELHKSGGGYRVHLGGGQVLSADHVVLALHAHAAARLVAPMDEELAAGLTSIPYTSAATVFLAWDRSQVRHPLDASGFLVPASERKTVMAATFVSSKWAGRAPEGKVLVRGFVGGAHDEAAVGLPDQELIARVTGEIAPLLGATGSPLFARVYRFVNGSPLPTLGHADRVARIRQRLSRLAGLHVIGNAYDGVGIPDCVRLANEAARRIVG
jgi:oxygen-dependent protoporphyrinogen oxidase